MSDREAMKNGPELCEPCQMFGWRDVPAVSQTGWDYTPTCRWHETHSFSQRPGKEPSEPRDFKLIPSVSDVLGKHDDDWLPSLQIKIELAPWYWRVGFYSAPGNGHFFILYLGPLVVNLWA